MKERVKKDYRLKRFYLRHAAPVMVWLVAVAAVVWLFHERVQRFEAVGIARGQVRQIAASSIGRIKEIPVQLFDPVKAGQPLAIVDTVTDSELVEQARLKAQLVTAGAEAERLSAELVPTQEKLRADGANMQMNQKDNGRRFEMDVDRARLRILDLQATVASQRVTLEGLAVQVKISQKLFEEEAIVPLELEKIKVQYEGVATRVQEDERLLEQAKRALTLAEQRRAEFATHELPEPSEDAVLEAIRKQIEVQEKIMKGLLEQLAAWAARRDVQLQSPIDGVVIPIPGQRNDALQQRPGEEVMRHVGEVVRAGDCILAVAEAKPTEIIMYVSEQQLGSLKERMPVELVKARTPAQIARSEIASIGPTIELMPQRLWRSPNLPQWGRPVLIGIPAGLELVPGEVVGIRGL
ncbi:MAG: HlyD family efflux transporter periplasmic adaptor subunit [Phycisphaerae bacterium]|nr:HlyD family efflux transporter periplasmic adaptor subunit [Phycisphaerae bacterium]